MFGSQLLEARPDFFRVMKSPFDGKEVVVVPALRPDWAIIHAHEADEQGNVRIRGSLFQDVLMSRAARRTIVTAERLVDTETFREAGERTSVPHFLVEAVVECPGGAAPGRCWPDYQVDDAGMKAYLQAVREGEASLRAYLQAVQ